MGLRSESYASAEEFLEHYIEGRPGCLVTDLRLMGISGLELQSQLIRRGCLLPVIVLTAFAQTPITVQAIKAGAVSVLDKPYSENDLWDAIRMALAKEDAERKKAQTQQTVQSKFEQLTPLEKKVLKLIVQGQPKKVIAKELDISVRTVANRRSDILAKTGAASTAELIRLAVGMELG
jgi:FixJ family two-component response regulator